MDPLEAVLTLATLASFGADVFAIIKGKRWQGVALLALASALAVALGFQMVHTAKVETQNALLTDSQVRAQRLVNSWNNDTDRFLPFENLPGTNEGIVAAAADLMEDLRECRPGAVDEARERLANARARHDKVLGEGFDADRARDKIWEDAAGAAYEQVAALTEVAPSC